MGNFSLSTSELIFAIMSLQIPINEIKKYLRAENLFVRMAAQQKLHFLHKYVPPEVQEKWTAACCVE